MTALISIYVSGNEIRKNHKSDLDNTVFLEMHETFEDVQQQCRWHYNKFGTSITRLNIISKTISSKSDSKPSDYIPKIKNEFEIISNDVGNLMFNGVYKINGALLKKIANNEVKPLIAICQSIQNTISTFDINIALDEDVKISNEDCIGIISSINNELLALNQATLNLEIVLNNVDQTGIQKMVDLILHGD